MVFVILLAAMFVVAVVINDFNYHVNDHDHDRVRGDHHNTVT